MLSSHEHLHSSYGGLLGLLGTTLAMELGLSCLVSVVSADAEVSTLIYISPLLSCASECMHFSPCVGDPWLGGSKLAIIQSICGSMSALHCTTSECMAHPRQFWECICTIYSHKWGMYCCQRMCNQRL